MKAFKVREALNAVGGRFYGEEAALDKEISFVTSDSRNAGPGSLFVAFKGARADGHAFIAPCLREGAVCCISERPPVSEEETPCIVVESSLRAMGDLASWYRSFFEIPVVGVTGSVGKTTTKEMIAAVLSRRFNTHKTLKNYNNELGVPQTILQLDPRHEAAVIEMGISNFGEMSRLTQMVRPDIAVISNIGYAHLEFLSDRQGVLKAKSEIFESMSQDKLAVLNGDDDLLKDLQPGMRRLVYGCHGDFDFVAKEIRNLGEDGISCVIRHHDREFSVLIPGFGTHMVYAALAATAVGYALGMTDKEIASGIETYQTVGSRAKVIQGQSVTVISDCYNANPTSVHAAIESLRMLDGRRVCILGDMLELGSEEEALHAQVGKQAAEAGIESIIACGERSKAIYEGALKAGGHALYFPNKKILMEQLPNLIRKEDKVLIKASHSMEFEEIADELIELQL